MKVNFKNNSSSSFGKNNVTALWSFGNVTIRPYSSVTYVDMVFNQAGTYEIVKHEQKNHCLQSYKRTIVVEFPSELAVPNVFTPHNEGATYEFFVKGINLQSIEAVIFDRWGYEVYKLSKDKEIVYGGKTNMENPYPMIPVFYDQGYGYLGETYDKNDTTSLFRYTK